MNILAPVSTIMSTRLVTVSPNDDLLTVKKIFDEHNIHHIPVVRFKEIVGMISKSDFLAFLLGDSVMGHAEGQSLENRLKAHKAEEIMTRGLAKLEPDDRINVALELFKLNRFHAIPVVRDGELVGILTPHDIIVALSEEKAPASAYRQSENK